MPLHPSPTIATIADLYQTANKAELVNGEIVTISPASAGHGRVCGKIFQSLAQRFTCVEISI
jgi:hypothetical protein